ncbi:MAG: hypothetical protein ACXU9K_08740 [Thermodesulfobacteriota bacterium]
MRNKIFILLGFALLLFCPNLVLSDCTDFGRVNSWYVQDENTIIAYRQNTPAAKIVLQDCTVNSSSNIRLMKSYLCDGDSLIIDGQECAIMTLTSASGESL